MDQLTRVNLLKQLIKERILVLDGAMGTALQNKNLNAQDFGGEAYEGCNEHLVLTRPDVIADVHRDYLEAGADIIETDTFGGTPLVLDEYKLGSKAYEINFKATEIARKLCDEFTQKNPSKPRFVAGSIGPTTKAISVTGGVTFEELIRNFYEQAKALYDGGADYFLIETCQDTRNIKAAIIGINDFLKTAKVKLPIAVSGTIEPMGTMLGGQSVDSLYTSLEHIDLLYIGLNCATGPEFMTDHVRTLSQMSNVPISCVPNAGLPDEDGKYLESPEMVSNVLERFIDKGWVNVIGGCCGTHSGHIKEMVKLAASKNSKHQVHEPASRLSGVDILEINNDGRPYIVGERTNVIGSKKFKELIAAEKYDEATEIAKAQVKKGAHIIDVCLANPDRDEEKDMKAFLELLIKKVRVPLMIDSTDEKVIDMALTYSQGKAIINSINLEDGEERFEKVLPLAKKYGAALVVGTIDDDKLQGMGVTRERKLSIAKRSYDLLVNKYGIKPSDIYWDPLVFPCATGDENYIGSAIETIEGIRLLKKEFPLTKTVLGISNVSFGLPEAGREVLNSVFLYLCTQAGLDLAIVNAEKIKRYAAITEEEKTLAENLLRNIGADPIAEFAAFYRGKKVEKKTDNKALPLEKRLPQYIIEGSKDGLVADLDEMLKKLKPMEVINGPLMEGMNIVGKLFNENKLIVAEVLQSAEAMKAAVTHLEQFMEKADSAKKGKIVLATVKGDVHDIGKNLVDIVLTNNGFDVINLGIKIPSEDLIKAIREHKPDILGLSGLLVKSAQQMVLSAEDLTNAHINVPIMVGGAALSRNFVNKKIAKAYTGEVMYAKDAMNGLDLANTIVDPKLFAKLRATLFEERKNLGEQEVVTTSAAQIPEVRSSLVPELSEIPKAPDYDKHVIKNASIEQIFKYINPLMIYNRHLGISGKLARLLDQGDFKTAQSEEGGEKALELFHKLEQVKATYKDKILKPKAVYQFFKAVSEKNNLKILDQKNNQIAEFNFPRQPKVDGLNIADYVSPDQNKNDNICLFVVTVGEGVREEAERLKKAGEYFESHALSALALESAEAYAEFLHSKIRALWGMPDSLDITMMERFQAKYAGKRYSFGYPACPRLDDQEILFKLLNPTSDIAVELTEGFMMDPEASVSAICFHHPKATYFSVGNQAEFN